MVVESTVRACFSVLVAAPWTVKTFVLFSLHSKTPPKTTTIPSASRSLQQVATSNDLCRAKWTGSALSGPFPRTARVSLPSRGHHDPFEVQAPSVGESSICACFWTGAWGSLDGEEFRRAQYTSHTDCMSHFLQDPTGSFGLSVDDILPHRLVDIHSFIRRMSLHHVWVDR